MFEALSDRFAQVFKNLKGQGKLTEKNIEDGLREVRMALLEADVHYKVVKAFLASVRERALGADVLESLTPGQQVVKIVNEELTRLMGQRHEGLRLGSSLPAVVMLVGLQGSGKTTTAGKLAVYLRGQGKRPFLVPADVQRPAAVAQLTKVARELSVPVYATPPESGDPVAVCRDAYKEAVRDHAEVVILDTAGRLHVDEELMAELSRIKKELKPADILLVADAMTGQDAVNMAKAFDEALDIGGVVLTKMDGDARGGAALSIRYITEKPVKFVGTGEKPNALEPFHPDRMASRILGMGDVLTLIEKARAAVDQKKAEELQKKLKKSEFTLEDFKDQMAQVRKMGSIEDLLGMIPGMKSKMKHVKVSDKDFVRIEAIINSMTPQERRQPGMINGSRRKRIAAGSGTSVQEVNRLLKDYAQAMKLMKQFSKGGMKGLGRMLGM
ncbi:MAG: signal recognition particle protein [Deltaproteobacteria bacterium]|nr:signal recognition particle protein [Deltaproteobacteria bacterium]